MLCTFRGTNIPLTWLVPPDLVITPPNLEDSRHSGVMSVVICTEYTQTINTREDLLPVRQDNEKKGGEVNSSEAQLN